MTRETWKLTIEARSLNAMAEAMKTHFPAKVKRCDCEGAPMSGCVIVKVKDYGSTKKEEFSVTWEMEEPEG